MAKLIDVRLIAAVVCKGDGTEESPKRSVEQWFDVGGTLLLEYDPYLDSTAMAFNMVEFLQRVADGKE